MKLRNLYHSLEIFLILFMLILPVVESTLSYSSTSNLAITSENQQEGPKEDAILWKYGQGLIGTGSTMQPRLVHFSQGGDPYIVVGMDGSLATISLDGYIEMSYITFGEVIDFDLIDDISGDNAADIVLNVYDQEHPNVIAISSKDSEELWIYRPQVESVDQTTLNTKYYTPYTWDVQTINDINNDGISDVAISAWYKVIVLDGKTGRELWVNSKDLTNDIWKIKLLDNMIIAGSENGELVALNEKDGQKIWSYKTPPIRMITISPEGYSEIDVPNSIDDIVIINDINNDNVDDLLVASDDGKVMLISGKLGMMLDSFKFFSLTDINLDWRNRYLEFHSQDISSPYSSVERIFQIAGAKFFTIPDINGDGKEDFLVMGCWLDYIWSNDNRINGTIFNINNGNFEILGQFSYDATYLYSSSYPTIINTSSDMRFFLYVAQVPGKSAQDSAGIYGININNKDFIIDGSNFTDPAFVYRDFDINIMYSKQKATFYLLNVGDINRDGIDDLFAISKYCGKYLLIDGKNNNVMWVRTIKPGEAKISQIQDINGDGVKDLLYKKIKDFNPNWMDTPVANGLINELLTLDAKTGKILWEFNLPFPQYYEGLRDLLDVGDINDDNIDDYAAWIIPSELPNSTKNIIKNLSGDSSLNLNDKEREEAIYRALLSNYTKLIIIDGSNGVVLWNTPLIDFIYNFYRDYANLGTYTNPLNLSSSGGDYYLRTNHQLPESWINGSDEILWNKEWSPSSLLHANSIGVEYGDYISGSLFDLSGEMGNYTIRAQEQPWSNLWATSVNLTFPLDFSGEKQLGLMEYPLSQLERFAALKMQTSLLVNDSTNPNWYNCTYEIYNESGGKWILCNWSRNIYWDSRYPDLYGSFNNSDNGGYRNDYNNFTFSTDFRDDEMYVMTRGTYNREKGLYFDYENETTLSDFIDSNKQITIRLNVTNGNKAFETSLQNFGIGAFYWGLYGNQYDRSYIYDYNLSSENYFTDINLLNLEVQAFKVINGTGDKYLDVLVVIGNDITDNSFNTKLRLFDIKYQKNYTKWSRTHTNIPYHPLTILPMNYSLNYWILSGTFVTGTTHYFSIKLIQNPHWDVQLSYFDNYDESKTIINFHWSINSPGYEILGKVNLTKDGKKIGLILGDSASIDKCIKIVDVSTTTITGRIATDQLLSSGGIAEDNIPNTGYKLLLSYDDFNGDNYLDHVGYYLKTYPNRFGGYETTELRVYSGNSGENESKVLFTYTPPVSEYWKEHGDEYQLSLEGGVKLPFASIGDINSDGISDAIIGLQMGKMNRHDSFNPFKGAYISYYDISSGSENNVTEITAKKWTLEPFHFIMKGWGVSSRIDFFDFIKNIGDFSGDGNDDVLVSRYLYDKKLYSITMDRYSYSAKKTLEILDPINQKTLFRFNLDMDSFYPLDDVNEDGKREGIITYGETFICVNSKFTVHFSNLEEGQKMQTNDFTIKWETTGNYDYFKVFINGNEYGSTTSTNLFVSLGGGTKKIDIYMYSRDGCVIAIDTVTINVPADFLFLGLIITISAVFACVFITYYQIVKRRRNELLIIDANLKKEGENIN